MTRADLEAGQTGMTESTDKPRGKADPPGPNFAGFLREEQPPRRADLAQAPVPSDPPTPGDPEAGSQDLARALVDRIADVDDDRRRSANQLRKALEAHRDEVRAARRRDRALAVFPIVLGVLLAGAAGWLYLELMKTRDALDRRITAAEQRIESAPKTPAPSEPPADIPTTADFDELANAIEAIGDRLTAAESRGGQPRQPDTEAETTAELSDTARIDIDQQIRGAEARMEKLLDERLTLVKERIDRLQTASEKAGKAENGAPGPRGVDGSTVQLKRSAGAVQTEQSTVVVQLAGFRERPAIDAFIRQHRLDGQLYLRTERWRGRPWYALIKSLHGNMAEAEVAAGALPPDLAQLDIWLRPLPAGIKLTTLGEAD
jgi:DamX protein